MIQNDELAFEPTRWIKTYSDKTIKEWFEWWTNFYSKNPLTGLIYKPNICPPFTYDELQKEMQRRGL